MDYSNKERGEGLETEKVDKVKRNGEKGNAEMENSKIREKR